MAGGSSFAAQPATRMMDESSAWTVPCSWTRTSPSWRTCHSAGKPGGIPRITNGSATKASSLENSRWPTREANRQVDEQQPAAADSNRNLDLRTMPPQTVEEPHESRLAASDPKMQFFTLKWWRGIQSGEITDPADAYRAHFQRIRDQLPPNLAVLSESISLHDSRLRSLNLDTEKQTLRISLDGDDGSGGLRRFSLTYFHVQSFESFADPDAGLNGPHGYGDLGYDESDVLSGGLFEHRILFSSGIEFRIAFADFTLAFTDESVD